MGTGSDVGKTIALIGNSKTRVIGDKMVTPRGYLEKYCVKEDSWQ